MSLKLDPKTGEWTGITGGVNLQELDNRKPVKQEIPQRDRQDEIRKEILKNENYAYAIRLIDYISNQLEIKMGKTIFRNRAASCYNPETKQIYFSYENLENSAKNGFVEYPTVGHIWIENGYKGKEETNQVGSSIRVNKFGTMVRKAKYNSYWRFENGKKAIWMLAIHEMAHRAQAEKNNNNFRGDHHGQIFQSELNDLIILFPYEKVKNI